MPKNSKSKAAAKSKAATDSATAAPASTASAESAAMAASGTAPTASTVDLSYSVSAAGSGVPSVLSPGDLRSAPRSMSAPATPEKRRSTQPSPRSTPPRSRSRSSRVFRRDRVYLSTEYDDRDEAKENGARWDKHAKHWYVSSEATTDEEAYLLSRFDIVEKPASAVYADDVETMPSRLSATAASAAASPATLDSRAIDLTVTGDASATITLSDMVEVVRGMMRPVNSFLSDPATWWQANEHRLAAGRARREEADRQRMAAMWKLEKQRRAAFDAEMKRGVGGGGGGGSGE